MTQSAWLFSAPIYDVSALPSPAHEPPSVPFLLCTKADISTWLQHHLRLVFVPHSSPHSNLDTPFEIEEIRNHHEHFFVTILRTGQLRRTYALKPSAIRTSPPSLMATACAMHPAGNPAAYRCPQSVQSATAPSPNTADQPLCGSARHASTKTVKDLRDRLTRAELLIADQRPPTKRKWFW